VAERVESLRREALWHRDAVVVLQKRMRAVLQQLDGFLPKHAPAI
jgi:hypothetical protein